MFVEIVPHQSMGELRLGAKRAELPAEANVNGAFGSYRDMEFRLDGDTVVDVWIDDLRTFPHELRFRGQPVARDASIEDLKALFGPCTKVEGILGGMYLNCASVTLGCDFAGKGEFVQLRLKPR